MVEFSLSAGNPAKDEHMFTVTISSVFEGHKSVIRTIAADTLGKAEEVANDAVIRIADVEGGLTGGNYADWRNVTMVYPSATYTIKTTRA